MASRWQPKRCWDHWGACTRYSARRDCSAGADVLRVEHSARTGPIGVLSPSVATRLRTLLVLVSAVCDPWQNARERAGVVHDVSVRRHQPRCAMERALLCFGGACVYPQCSATRVLSSSLDEVGCHEKRLPCSDQPAKVFRSTPRIASALYTPSFHCALWCWGRERRSVSIVREQGSLALRKSLPT